MKRVDKLLKQVCIFKILTKYQEQEMGLAKEYYTSRCRGRITVI